MSTAGSPFVMMSKEAYSKDSEFMQKSKITVCHGSFCKLKVDGAKTWEKLRIIKEISKPLSQYVFNFLPKINILIATVI